MQDETKLEKKSGRVVRGKQPMTEEVDVGQTTRRGRRTTRSIWLQMQQCFLQRERRMLTGFMSVNSRLTGIFLSFTQSHRHTHSVIPHVGTDTHSLRGGIGLVKLSIISSHRCNQSQSMVDDTYVIPLWGPRCAGELHGKETSSHQIHTYLAPFPYNGGNIDFFLAAYMFHKKPCVNETLIHTRLIIAPFLSRKIYSAHLSIL